MAKTINVRCNGSGRHVNEVHLDTLLQPTTVLRGGPRSAGDIAERYVKPCRYCAEGKVILTREMIKKALGR